MSSPETALQEQHPLNPAELAHLSNEQIQAMIANGLVDPSLAELHNLTGEFPISEYAPADALLPQQAGAEQQLVAAEQSAITAASHGDNGLSDAFYATEKAMHDTKVESARSALEEIFGGRQLTNVTERATERALELSQVATTNKTEIATAVAENRSPVAELTHKLPDDKSAKKYAELKDKLNGEADTVVDKLAKKTREELKEYGVYGETIKALGGEIVKSAGAKLTTTGESIAVVEEEIGEKVIESLVSGKPRMTEQLRAQIKKLGLKGQLKELARAVSTYRGSGQLSKGTKRLVGKQFRHTHRRSHER